MYPLVETIKIVDGIPQNLKYHKFRFEESYLNHFNSLPEMTFPMQISVPAEYKTGIVKLRLLYDKNDFRLEYSFYKKKKIHTLKPVFDDNINYPVKYTDRTGINKLLAQKEDRDDILIIKNGFVTDSSFTNIVFFDGVKWYTPSTPLLSGTARKRLIDMEKIVPTPIKFDDIKSFKKFKLINAMIDFDEAPEIEIKNIYPQVT